MQKKKIPRRRESPPPTEETLGTPVNRIRYCRDCGNRTSDVTHVRCPSCNTRKQKWWDDHNAEAAAAVAAEKAERISRIRSAATASTPQSPRRSSDQSKLRVVLTVHGSHSDRVRRVAMKRKITLSQLADDLVTAIPPEIGKPKSFPSASKGDGGNAVLCIYGSQAERVRHLLGEWEIKLAQFAAWLVEGLKE